MRRIAVWYFLLNKRFLKKYSFLLILCLVPLIVAGMRMASQEESGIVRIALCQSNPEDELSAKIVRQLTERDSILQYVLCETEEEARTLVETFEVDVAWIFPEDLEQSLRETALSKHVGPVVKVVEREDDSLLIFSRKILSTALYPDFSYEVYKDFVRDDMELGQLSEEELRAAYERTLVEGALFRMVYLDGEPVEEDNYLMAPIRGILAIWLVLCGLAGSMYFIQDEQRGTFSRMTVWRRLWTAFGMHAVLLSDAVIVLLVSCAAAGVFTVWKREILSALLLACCTAVFCNLLRMVCRTMARLGSCIPILLIGMMILCPVFINIRQFKAVQYLMPPYYYLKSIHSTYYLYGMIVYTGAAFILCVLLAQWQNRKN